MGLLCLLPQVGTATAPASGVLFSLLLGNPWPVRTGIWSRYLLQLSVVGLGFGMKIGQVWLVGKQSVAWSVASILLTEYGVSIPCPLKSEHSYFFRYF